MALRLLSVGYAQGTKCTISLSRQQMSLLFICYVNFVCLMDCSTYRSGNNVHREISSETFFREGQPLKKTWLGNRWTFCPSISKPSVKFLHFKHVSIESFLFVCLLFENMLRNVDGNGSNLNKLSLMCIKVCTLVFLLGSINSWRTSQLMETASWKKRWRSSICYVSPCSSQHLVHQQ